MTLLDFIREVEGIEPINKEPMDKEKALSILKNTLTCMELDDKACFGKGCNRDCDYCDYCYTQGTRSEQKEAFALLISLLEDDNNNAKPSDKSYEDGCNDIWRLVKELWNNTPTEEMAEIFEFSDICMDEVFTELLNKYSSTEALSKFNSYKEKKAELHIGDIVKQTFTEKEFYILSKSKDKDFDFDVIDLDTFEIDSVKNFPDHFKKTGKTIDLKTLFDKIN